MATIPTARLKDIPALARDNSNLSAVMDAIREAMQTFRGYRGDPLDQALTLRTALDKGVLLNSALNGYGKGPLVGPGSPDWPVTSLEADLTPPPTPTGLTATAGITYIYVNCDVPLYTQGHGHDRTVVYGAKWPTGDPAPTFSGAVELFTFQGTVGAYPSEPATRWCIWIKWKSNDGVLSVSPAGGTNGVTTTTGQDVSRLLTALTGQITAGQLYTDLGARINLIDTPTTGLIDRMNAANASIVTINATLADIASTPAYDNATSYVLDDIVSYSGGLYQAKSSTTGNLPTNTTYWTKIGDYTSIGDAVAGHSVILSDHDTRITNNAGAVTAVAGRATVLEAAVNSATTGLSTKASVSYVDTATASINGALAVQSSTVSAVSTVANAATANADSIGAAGMALNFNPDCNNPNIWPGTYITTITDGVTGNSILAGSSGEHISESKTFAFNHSKRYRVSALIRKTSGVTSGSVYLGLLNYDVNGAQQYTWGGYVHWSMAATSLSTSFVRYSTDFVPGTTNAGTVRAAMHVILGYPNTGGGRVEFQDVRVEDITEAYAAQVEASAINDRLNTGDYATVKVQAAASASAITGLYAQYTVKLDVGGKVSGYGLASSATASEFAIRADRFYIAPPAGTSGISDIIPFVVQTAPATINGVYIPPGVYMDAAYIVNLNAMLARLGSAWIDNAMIANLSAAKLTAGDGSIGGNLRSATFTSGSVGWLLQPNGNAEFNNVVVRGTVYASAGTFSGDISASTGNFRGQVTGGSYSGYAFPASGDGFYLGAGGLLLGNYNTGKYLHVSAAGDIYAPDFSIVNGTATFSGNLAAGTATFDSIVSKSATEFIATYVWLTDNVWINYAFNMEHAGDVVAIITYGFNTSNVNGTYAVYSYIDSYGTPDSQTGGNDGTVNIQSFGNSIAAGTHNLWLKAVSQYASGQHLARFCILRSYR